MYTQCIYPQSRPAAVYTGCDGLHTIATFQPPASLDRNSTISASIMIMKPFPSPIHGLLPSLKCSQEQTQRPCKCMVITVNNDMKKVNYAKPKYSLPAVMAVYTCCLRAS